MVAVEQDVTERLRVQEQLQMQAGVLESMAEAVLMLDDDGTVLLTNPAAETLLGYERGELVGKPMMTMSAYAPRSFTRCSSAAGSRSRRRVWPSANMWRGEKTAP